MSSQPESMAEAARAGSTPPHRGLPEEIVIWEILVRLPPKSLLRCRAVCGSWRRATFTRDFLLAHHARQPSLPLLHGYNWVHGDVESIDIIPFDRRSGPAAADPDPLSSIARLRLHHGSHDRLVSCDGIFISSYCDMFFTICNPATRQFAPLPQLDGFRLLGMYMHSPTGEYRVLLCSGREMAYDAQNCYYYYYYVFTLGSDKPPRQIGYRNAVELAYALKTVQFRGNLHWCIGHTSMTIAFDTTSELFRQMRAPVLPGYAYLFEMDDMMGMSSFVEGHGIVDIWVLQDYEGEIWTCKCRVELPLAELRMQLEFVHNPWCVEATSWYGEVLLLVKFHDWIIHVDINGKLVARIRHRGIFSTQLRIKQSLVLHTFFPTQEGYVVNTSPFI